MNENGAVKLFKQRVRFFMPRIGIAFRPWDKWVLRAGAGWFDNINHLNTWTIFNLMPPKSGSLLFNVRHRPRQERATCRARTGSAYSVPNPHVPAGNADH